MSPKQQRKFHGIRRSVRRPRNWVRWFRDGLLETDPPRSVRLHSTLWSTRVT